MTFVVTGARGSLGQEVVKSLLKRGNIVYSIERTDDSLERFHYLSSPDPHRSEPFDLPSLLRTLQPDAIIHLAGSFSAKEPIELYRANVVYAEKLLSALKNNKMENVTTLIVGSAAEYGVVDRLQMPIAEKLTPKPSTHYGISKLSQTFITQSYARQGLSVCVARVFNIASAKASSALVLGKFLRQVRERQESGSNAPIVMGNLSSSRDFLSSSMAADCLIRLINSSPRPGEIFNICSGEATQISKLLIGIRDHLELKSQIESENEIRLYDMPTNFGCNEKFLKQTGYRPRFSISDAIKEICCTINTADGGIN